MSNLSIDDLMDMSTLEYLETIQSCSLMTRKQIEKGLEIELQRLNMTINRVNEAFTRMDSEEKQKSLNTLVNLGKLQMKMAIRIEEVKAISCKIAKEMMSIKQ